MTDYFLQNVGERCLFIEVVVWNYLDQICASYLRALIKFEASTFTHIEVTFQECKYAR